MLQITETIDINAPADDVWKRIAKLDDVQNFVDSVTKSYYSSDQKEGVGAERTCEVQGFGTLVEEIVDWKDGETLTYTVDGMPPFVKHAQSTWRLERKNDFQTKVIVTSLMDTRYGPFGRLMENLAMKPRITKLLRGALVQFKDYVEQSSSQQEAAAQPVQANVA